jgi:GNAT superfamily N-acetyltransferase
VSAISLRPAQPEDAPLVFQLVSELADYERLSDAVDATPQMLAEALFRSQPRVFCDLAFADGDPAGLAVWFYNFSTFRGRHGIWLEDLFVRPAFRGRGIGLKLMQRLAARCLEENLARFEWTVLDWNEPSIAFYQRQGAVLLDDWTTCRLDGEALRELAGATG